MAYPKGITLTADEYDREEFPPVEMVLGQWLPTRGLALISARAGVGKTFLALSAAVAVASGTTVLAYGAPVPRTVLYVDGEMDPADTQMRLREIRAGLTPEANALVGRNLRLLQHNVQPFGIPPLEKEEGQEWISREAREPFSEVIFLDNLSSMTTSGNEDKAEDWKPIQNWLLSQRRDGHTTVLVHHTGHENFDQDGNARPTRARGTSDRFTVMNSSMVLTKHRSMKNTFSIRFDKFRGGEDPPEELATIVRTPGVKCQLISKSQEGVDRIIREKTDAGQSYAETGRQLGMSGSAVSHRMNKLAKMVGKKE